VADIFTKAKRSAVMARVRSRGNRSTETVVASLFRRHGFAGWRRHFEVRVKKVGGQRAPLAATAAAGGSELTPRRFRVRPDFVFPKLRVAVFVDGCFWHACPQHGTRPRGNRAFWRKKLAANKERDRLVNRTLRRTGWRVIRIWEHALTRKREARLVARLRRWLG
jgi:DNA mismatch endonuclease, patch repair protein